MQRSEALACIILAAGASSRMGIHKSKILWREQSFLKHCVEQAQTLHAESIVIVAGHTPILLAEHNIDAAQCQVIDHQAWAKGPLSSLQAALRHLVGLKKQTLQYALVRSVDRPRISLPTLTALVQTAKQHPSHIVQPRIGKKRAHPIIYPRSMWEAILELEASASIRPFLLEMEQKNARTYVDVQDAGVLENFDTPESLTSEMRIPTIKLN